MFALLAYVPDSNVFKGVYTKGECVAAVAGSPGFHCPCACLDACVGGGGSTA
jgi:hypothetical protein